MLYKKALIFVVWSHHTNNLHYLKLCKAQFGMLIAQFYQGRTATNLTISCHRLCCRVTSEPLTKMSNCTTHIPDSPGYSVGPSKISVGASCGWHRRGFGAWSGLDGVDLSSESVFLSLSLIFQLTLPFPVLRHMPAT